MQWDDSENAGFTTGEPWIKVNPNYKEINAKAALNDPDSVFYYYQKLIRLRREYLIVVYGIFSPLLLESDKIYAYERKLDDEVLVVACNWTSEEVPCTLFDSLGEADTELITNVSSHKEGFLLPYEARVILKKC